MEHRGACSADDDSGDGAGLMTQIPWKLLKKEFPSINEATTGCVSGAEDNLVNGMRSREVVIAAPSTYMTVAETSVRF